MIDRINDMQIWVDGDACPNAIKTILFRSAIRTKTQLVLVANHAIYTPPSEFIKKHQVLFGLDVADQYILDHMKTGDLVITADIPLADGVITQGGFALNPRGEMYTAQNIKYFLSIRNLNESLRSGNVQLTNIDKLGQKEIRSFANNLDKFMAKK